MTPPVEKGYQRPPDTIYQNSDFPIPLLHLYSVFHFSFIMNCIVDLFGAFLFFFFFKCNDLEVSPHAWDSRCFIGANKRKEKEKAKASVAANQARP